MIGVLLGVLKPFLTIAVAEKAITTLVNFIVKSNKNPFDDDLALKIAEAFKEWKEAFEAGKEVYEEIKGE